MRLVPLLVLLLLLPLPSTLTAAPASVSAPGWLVGESWNYLVTDGSGKPVGNLAVKVVSDGPVRVGNSTVQAYVVWQLLQPWTPPANNTKLTEEARWGPIYTVINTSLIIEKKTLCILRSNSTIRQVHYADVTRGEELLVYSPSDGRLRFPLSAGISWNVTFNLTRTHRYPFQVITDNSTIARSYECQAYDTLPDGKEGFRIICADDGTGQEITSWYSPRYRSEVRREERNAATGTVRVYTLLEHSSGVAPSIFSSPQTWLAIIFAAVATTMLLGAIYTGYRAKHPKDERDKVKKPAEAPDSRPPAATQNGPPAGPAPPAAKGPGRIL